jgi:hypothetical protein
MSNATRLKKIATWTLMSAIGTFGFLAAGPISGGITDSAASTHSNAAPGPHSRSTVCFHSRSTVCWGA